MKIIDFMGRENEIPDTDYEKGRQEAITEMEGTVKRQLNFLEREKENITAIPKDVVADQIEVYKYIAGKFALIRSKNIKNQYYGN